MSKFLRTAQQGFTIIELMIATSVLSVILVMVTVVMINIGDLYYKGVNQVRIQNAVRSVSDEISQQLQLSNGYRTGSRATGEKSYCIGTTMYSYIIGTKIGNENDPSDEDQPHVLWRSETAPGACTPVSLIGNNSLSGGAELMPPQSRLTHFEISPTTSPYSISIAMAYGHKDLFDPAATGVATRCRGVDDDGDAQKGRQFCATAKLLTYVVQRLQGE